MMIFIRSKVETLEDFIPLAEKYDVGIEVAISFEDLDSFNGYEKLKNIPVTVHAPFFDVNIASFNRFVSDKSVEIMQKTVQICNLLNAKNVVFHHNYSPFVYNFNEDDYCRRFVENFEKVIALRGDDLFISFENVFETNASIGKKIVDAIQKDYVGFCFDCGHFNLFSEITIEEWIEQWNGKIFEFHLHNNYGYRDDHNSLQLGNIDVKKLLSLQQVNFYTIENRNLEDTEQSIIYLKQLCR